MVLISLLIGNFLFVSYNRQFFSEELNARRISHLTETRKLLNEYALCACITYVTDVDKLRKDISHGIYIDISNSGHPNVYKEIDSVSKVAALTMNHHKLQIMDTKTSIIRMYELFSKQKAGFISENL